MTIKALVDEDFVNYKVPSMFIINSQCSFKCDRESDKKICQNSSLIRQQDISIDNEIIAERYFQNPITNAIVFGGLEPMDQFEDVFETIKILREDLKCDDDVVIYTGYNENEIPDRISALRKFKNVIMKFGRFLPNHERHFDEVLGVYLPSDNQYARKIS